MFNERSLPSFTILVLQLLFMVSYAAADISFITGTWTGGGAGTDRIHFCLKASLKASNVTQFSGTLFGLDDRTCTMVTDTCKIQGQVSGTDVGFSADCQGNPCTFTGQLNTSFSSFSGKFDCPGDPESPYSIQLTKPIAIQDVSQTSGIANQNVQTSGVQWIDYNKDKKLDLYLVGHNGNVLFKNIGKGKFVDVTTQTKTGNNGKDASGASWADIDNDGDHDVFIANANGPATLLENRKGVFVDISNKISSLSAASPSAPLRLGGLWLDINNDKNIDLFQVFEGGPNLLAKNTGSKSFVNITTSAGVLYSGNGRSAVSADFNNDGYQDIYLVNFHESNRLYINNKNETFTEMGASAGVNFSGGSVQAIVSDYDNDDDFDIFVVNNEGPSILYQNLGNLKFKIATSPSIKRQTRGIAAAFHDFDGDQDEDLILAQTSGKKNLLFLNTKGKFKVKKGLDLSNPDNPTGIAIGDFNQDGYPDIAIGDGDDSQQNGDSLYQNTGGGGNHYLVVALKGKQSQRNGIGATAVVQTGFSEFQKKTVAAGNGQNQGSFDLDFGLGPNLKVDFLRIFWPSGIQQTLQDVDADRRIVVVEPK